MALFDKLKDMLKGREEQVRTATEKVGGAVGKVGEFVDEKTKGKYSDKISSAGQKTQEAIHKAGDKVAAVSADGTASTGGSAPAPGSPTTAAPDAAQGAPSDTGPGTAANAESAPADPPAAPADPPPVTPTEVPSTDTTAAADGVGTDKPEGTAP